MGMQAELFDDVPQKSTLQLVKELKANGEDFEFFPTSDEQLHTISEHMKQLFAKYEVTNRYDTPIKLLDIGAGDGRCLTALSRTMAEIDSRKVVKLLAIEKATTQIKDYASKDIVLLGTEFWETNFISKQTDIGFSNPPFSEFSLWIQTILGQLSFKAFYAILPRRWRNDEAIKDVIKRRNITNVDIIAESDFYEAERAARTNVDLVCFYFGEDESTVERKRKVRDDYKPMLGVRGKCSFQLFIENELGLVQTHSETTNKFNELQEKERIRAEMAQEGTRSYELVKSEGVLAALLEHYEQDMQQILEQYKNISKIDSSLLAELGVKYDAIRESVKEKLFGMRNLYWNLLFTHLTPISSRLTTNFKNQLLTTLNNNALDFTMKNALYIVDFAITYANNLVEDSLISVFRDLSCESSIKRYYRSNERMYNDRWRHNNTEDYKQCKILLDYRFIYSSWGNFGNYDWQRGLNESARDFTHDLLVVMRLLGYGNLYLTEDISTMTQGDKLSIRGTGPDGKELDLVQVRYYANGNRHIKINTEAMARFNTTVSRLLGWVRNREEYQEETGSEEVTVRVWDSKDNIYIQPNSVKLLN